MLEDEGFWDHSAILGVGIYVLSRRGRVVYVGQTQKGIVRLYQHANAQGKLRSLRGVKSKLKVGFHFDKIMFRPCKIAELDALEKEYIERLAPVYNVIHNPVPAIPLGDLIRTLAIPTPEASSSGFRRRV